MTDVFTLFTKTHKEDIQKMTINANNIPIDDEWIKENEWDKIYKQEREEEE